MLIFSLSDSFVEICDCTPLYANSFDLNARHSQVLGIVRRHYVGVVRRYAPPFSTLRIRSIGRPFQNLSDTRTRLPRTPVRASVDARSYICRTPVPVSVRTGVGWKLYYDAYHRTRRKSSLLATVLVLHTCQGMCYRSSCSARLVAARLPIANHAYSIKCMKI